MNQRTQTHPKHRARRRILDRSAWGATVLAMMLGGLVPLLAASPAEAAPGAVSPGRQANGFPEWFQDESGTRLQPCLDPADSRCVVLADAGFDPARPVSFPTNFPEEFFYTIVDSQRLATTGCQGTRRGTISMRFALEGAFANGQPVPGDQMVFGRVRLTVTSGLCANADYTVVHPFGRLTFRTDNAGSIARNQGTTDVGCVPVAPQTCDYALALASPVAKTFLRWDPAFAPAAPAGYLGDATTPHRITGATYTAPGEAAPANFVRVTGPRLDTPLTTNLFTVSGKLAGALTARSSLDFGGQETGTASAARDVVVTNLADGPVTPEAASLTGADAGEFQVVSDGCAGVALARDASCTVQVAFAPTVGSARSAVLSVPHGSFNGPLTVALGGTGVGASAQAHATAAPSSIDFGRQRVRVRSGVQSVTLTSDGAAPLQVGQIRFTGQDSDQFTVLDDRCTGTPVAVGSTCTVGLAFDPTRPGAASAQLLVDSNDPASPLEVGLSGEGYGGNAAVSDALDPVNGMPEWYQDEAGVRLLQCVDPADTSCIVLPGGTFGGTGPLSFPDNYPDEWFYYLAESDQVPTDGCGGLSDPGSVAIRVAVEAAFANGEPAAGDQMTFGRVRVRASGLCPDTAYTFVHPYGVVSYTTDSAGSVKPSPGTEDVGCLAAGGGTVCDWGLALQSRVLEGFVRWDPATGPAAPAGYLGDGVTFHAITGAPYTHPGDSAPANSFRVFRGDQLIGRTDQFAVMGKLGGPLVADRNTLEFGGVTVGESGSQTLTLSNAGQEPLTLAGLAVGGRDAADFAVGADDRCTGATLAPGDACSVAVELTPSGVGERQASLRIEHSGLNNPLDVVLHGTGKAFVGTPALSVDRQRVAFTDLHVGRVSEEQRLVVSNQGGSAPLVLGTPTWDGAGAVNFAVTGSTCGQPVPEDGTCELRLVHAPVSAGAHAATLVLSGEGSQPASLTVDVSGTGFAGTSAVSATTRGDGFPTWYQDANGVRLEPCLENTGRCVLLADAGFEPAQPVSFPDNYPAEMFYAIADSDPVATPGCGGSAPGSALLRLALEGTFTGAPEPGQQLVFGRSRITINSGLCPGESYTFTTPYGEVTGTANAQGGFRATTDIGCGAAPCTFAAALGSPVLDSFVRWAPGSGAAAPNGYLGDGVTPHRIVGATHRVGGELANWFSIADASGTEVARTSAFVVSGKEAGGLTGTDVAFPDQQISTTSGERAVTFVNIGRTAAAVAAAELVGPGAAAFAIAGGTCTAGPVASDASCAVRVTFAPPTVSAFAATVRLVAADGSVLGRASVTGQGVDAGLPRVAISPTAVAFGSQPVGTAAPTRNVQVSNTGTGVLTVSGVELSGAQSGDFSAVAGATCATLAPGASCVVQVGFSPTGSGARAAVLQVRSNDLVSGGTVALTGTGAAAAITLKSGVLDFGKVRAGRTSTQSVTLTNSGTVALALTGLTVEGSTEFSAALGSCGAALQPGRKCSFSVTFRASAPLGTRQGTVRFHGNVVDPPALTVRATVD